MASENAEDLVPCPECGHLNSRVRIICPNCSAQLRELPVEKTRPGCVTVYAVLLGIVGVLAALAGIIIGISELTGGFQLSGFGLIVCGGGLFSAMLSLGIAYGLWNLKNWARILVIIIQSLSIVSTICYALSVVAGGGLGDTYNYDPNSSIGGSIVNLIENGIILWWFASHGEYFD